MGTRTMTRASLYAKRRQRKAESILKSRLRKHPELHDALTLDIRVSGSYVVEAYRASPSEPFQFRDAHRPQGAEDWGGVPHTTKRPTYQTP